MEPSGRPEGPSGSRNEAGERVARYPLMEALLERRSHRFGYGMNLNGDRSPATAPTPRSR